MVPPSLSSGAGSKSGKRNRNRVTSSAGVARLQRPTGEGVGGCGQGGWNIFWSNLVLKAKAHQGPRLTNLPHLLSPGVTSSRTTHHSSESATSNSRCSPISLVLSSLTVCLLACRLPFSFHPAVFPCSVLLPSFLPSSLSKRWRWAFRSLTQRFATNFFTALFLRGALCSSLFTPVPLSLWLFALQLTLHAGPSYSSRPSLSHRRWVRSAAHSSSRAPNKPSQSLPTATPCCGTASILTRCRHTSYVSPP